MNESISLADARPRSSNAALAGALVLLGGADVRGPPGGTAEAALAEVGGRGRRVAPGPAAAQRRGRVGVRGSPRARQRVDADAVRRSPVTVVVHQCTLVYNTEISYCLKNSRYLVCTILHLMQGY